MRDRRSGRRPRAGSRRIRRRPRRPTRPHGPGRDERQLFGDAQDGPDHQEGESRSAGGDVDERAQAPGPERRGQAQADRRASGHARLPQAGRELCRASLPLQPSRRLAARAREGTECHRRPGRHPRVEPARDPLSWKAPVEPPAPLCARLHPRLVRCSPPWGAALQPRVLPGEHGHRCEQQACAPRGQAGDRGQQARREDRAGPGQDQRDPPAPRIAAAAAHEGHPQAPAPLGPAGRDPHRGPLQAPRRAEKGSAARRRGLLQGGRLAASLQRQGDDSPDPRPRPPGHQAQPEGGENVLLAPGPDRRGKRLQLHEGADALPAIRRSGCCECGGTPATAPATGSRST